jgi:hypothetical protein
MGDTEQIFMEKAAMSIFNTLLAFKKPEQDFKEIAGEAYRAARALLSARNEAKMDRYAAILEKHGGSLKGFRAILELDGFSGERLERTIRKYLADSRDLLRQYEDCPCFMGKRPTAGQLAVKKYLEKHPEYPLF